MTFDIKDIKTFLLDKTSCELAYCCLLYAKVNCKANPCSTPSSIKFTFFNNIRLSVVSNALNKSKNTPATLSLLLRASLIAVVINEIVVVICLGM